MVYIPIHKVVHRSFTELTPLIQLHCPLQQLPAFDSWARWLVLVRIFRAFTSFSFGIGSTSAQQHPALQPSYL